MATVTTLPATFVSGAVLTAAQQNDLRGAFRVLQVVSIPITSESISNTNTLIDTNVTANITPSNTSSKILVIVNHTNCYKSGGTSGTGITMKLNRGGTDIYDVSQEVGLTSWFQATVFSVSFAFLDSPSSVAALTYKTRFASSQNVAEVRCQVNGLQSNITLMEISA